MANEQTKAETSQRQGPLGRLSARSRLALLVYFCLLIAVVVATVLDRPVEIGPLDLISLIADITGILLGFLGILFFLESKAINQRTDHTLVEVKSVVEVLATRSDARLDKLLDLLVPTRDATDVDLIQMQLEELQNSVTSELAALREGIAGSFPAGERAKSVAEDVENLQSHLEDELRSLRHQLREFSARQQLVVQPLSVMGEPASLADVVRSAQLGQPIAIFHLSRWLRGAFLPKKQTEDGMTAAELLSFLQTDLAVEEATPEDLVSLVEMGLLELRGSRYFAGDSVRLY